MVRTLRVYMHARLHTCTNHVQCILALLFFVIIRYYYSLLLFIVTRYIYSVLLLTLLLLHFSLVFICIIHYYYALLLFNKRARVHTHTHTHTHTRNTHTRAHALSTSLLHASCMMPCTCASLLHGLYISLSLSCLVHDTPACKLAYIH